MTVLRALILVLCLIVPTVLLAEPIPIANPPPLLTATPPSINAKGYILLDAGSGKVLAAMNPEQRMEPASLTKMMTSYVISQALRQGRIHLNDPVSISAKAWHTGGSKMFVKIGDNVPVQDLLQGIIVQSGNDACIAMAEFIAGSEEGFVSLMNQAAQQLGMKNSHFMDSTGLPDPNHYSTPHDMALLGRALIQDFPEDYKWYSQKWFVYNGIRQPNRNRLLWRDASVDGIKTGHTEEAGFCLVASAQRNGMRLITVVMGAPTDAARADDSEALLTYGFRFFETHHLYAAGSILKQATVWKGIHKQLPLGTAQDIAVTLPTGQYQNLKMSIDIAKEVIAPVKKGQSLGQLKINLNGETIATYPVVALADNPQAGIFSRCWDAICLMFRHLFHKGE